MAMIYEEDWAAGTSLFDTMYRYDLDDDGPDSLYPYMFSAEGVYLNGDGYLDKNPAYTGPFEDYQSAGIWVKGMGSLDTDGVIGVGGFWNADKGCIEVTYIPTTTSLGEHSGGNYDPLLALVDPLGLGVLRVDIDLGADEIIVHYQCEGPDVDATIPDVTMPVAGEPYVVRMEWQCGTMDLVEEVTAADGFIRVWINDILIYEAVDVTLFVRYPNTYMDSLPNLADGATFGYAGLLGPLVDFHIEDTLCVVVEDDVETDLEDEELEFEFDASEKQTIGLIWVDAFLPD